jgi:hypothetical protein
MGIGTKVAKRRSSLETFIVLAVRALCAKPAFFLGLRGRVALSMSDDRSITVCFGDAKAPFQMGAREDAELRLTMSNAVLGHILDGTIDAEAELESGALKVEGDVRLLESLARLIQSGRSLLAVRCGK